ncbi:MAG TPA: 4-hydroxy-3-methylbut-2-enyl diphosphate reductase [Clostridia bacterium]|nr:4-hydroxy-3-methylbut-2-enyl diphosphate reductase [Clostridia bacterium]
MPKITIAKNAGFCSGVESAYSLALSLAKKGERVFTFGELIHNSLAVSYLEKAGVRVINSVDEAQKGDTVILRTHGTSEKIVERLKARGAVVVDATCPFVIKIHKIVKEYYEKGYRILIAGEREHAEVEGINSFANNEAVIFSDALPPILDNEKYCLVFQTTFSLQKYEKIIEELENISKDGHKTVVYFNTICYTTKGRQEEVARLALKSDAVVVVGSRDSANTTRLYEIAKDINPNVYFLEKLDDISFDIKQFFSIAIVSGASTPKWLLEEVVSSMSETQNDNAKGIQLAEKDTGMKNEATSLDQTKVKKSDDTFSMEDIINDNSAMGFTSYTPGKRVKGRVISADDTGIRVALGGKKDGFIAKEDATLDNTYNPENFKTDDEIEAVIISQDREKVQLSKKEIDAKRLENEEAERTLSQEIFELSMTEVVKGGLRGRLGGYTVFVPASHIKIGYVHDLEEYKNKKLRLMVMPPKKEEGEEEGQQDRPQKKSKYIFASQRMVLEKEKKEREDAFWNSIHVHDIVIGKVKRFTSIGAFVNVKGYDCLCHISEISWNTISDPSDVLKLNESYDFVVLKMDRETGKISLGYKQLQKKPYELAADKFPVGTIVDGKVARIKSYGAFVQIDDGVDGLVHVSQIAHNWIKDATEVFQIGQAVRAKIIGFDDNRITLSIKELLPPPEETTAPASEEVEESEQKPSTVKRPSRVKKFEDSLANVETRQRGDRRAKRETTSNEPKEWISNAGSATLGDLFKGLDLKFEDDIAEEKPTAPKAEADKTVEIAEDAAKKTVKKAAKKVEEVETVAEVVAEKKPAKKATKKAEEAETENK